MNRYTGTARQRRVLTWLAILLGLILTVAFIELVPSKPPPLIYEQF